MYPHTHNEQEGFLGGSAQCAGPSGQKKAFCPLNLWDVLADSSASYLKTEFVSSALGSDSVKIFGLYLRLFVFLCKH